MAKAKKVIDEQGEDLFAVATAKKKAQPKKPAGTTFQLPQELDAVGNLTAKCAELHEAIATAIKAKKEMSDAENRGNAAKGLIKPIVASQYANKVATSGCLPNTPIVVTNHRGESLTYVITDKTATKGLSDEQLEMLKEMLGPDTVDRITMEFRTYGFCPETMQEISGEVPVGLTAEEVVAMPRVHNIVAKRVSAALAEAVEAGEITAEQRSTLLTADIKTLLCKGEFENLAQFTGADVSRIEGVLEALDGVVIRYLKA